MALAFRAVPLNQLYNEMFAALASLRDLPRALSRTSCKKSSWIDQNRNMAKTSRSAEDRRLARLTKICLALPEALRRDMGQHAAFLVRKKTFAYYLNDHHGDGIVSIACKALPGENKALSAAQPTRFYLPSYIGPRGWVALRLDTGETDWEEVGELILGSYRLIAPRRLVGSIKLPA